MGLPATTALNTTAPNTTTGSTAPASRSRFYPWIVFALTFGLLLSDYMSRQVLSLSLIHI